MENVEILSNFPWQKIYELPLFSIIFDNFSQNNEKTQVQLFFIILLTSDSKINGKYSVGIKTSHTMAPGHNFLPNRQPVNIFKTIPLNENFLRTWKRYTVFRHFYSTLSTTIWHKGTIGVTRATRFQLVGKWLTDRRMANVAMFVVSFVFARFLSLFFPRYRGFLIRVNTPTQGWKKNVTRAVPLSASSIAFAYQLMSIVNYSLLDAIDVITSLQLQNTNVWCTGWFTKLHRPSIVWRRHLHFDLRPTRSHSNLPSFCYLVICRRYLVTCELFFQTLFRNLIDAIERPRRVRHVWIIL